jgi:Ca-activated chloride channel family protein
MKEMFRFENTEYLLGLLIIPVFILLFLLYRVWRKRALKRFGDMQVVTRLMPFTSDARPILKFILIMIAYIFVIIGLANPQIGSRLEKVQRKGADLMIALDVSNSMLAQDIRPDRLTRSVQAISKLIDNLEGDRIGIVVFAGKAYMQLPITTDYAAAKMFLSTINTQMVPTQGTAIAEAIHMASGSFKQDDRSKALIIITDGEDHEGDAIKEATAAAEKGIRIFTIGMGSPNGAPIPEYYPSGAQKGFKKDSQGQTVMSSLNETMLQQISSAGNGIYTRATTGRDGLSSIFEEINKLEKAEIETQMFSEYEDRFQYFLAFALLFLLIEIMVPEKRSKWADKIRLFNR